MASTRIFADALFDGERLVRNASFCLDDEGRVTTFSADVPPATDSNARRLPAGALVIPGLVNAHTHLELSALAGAVSPRGPTGESGPFGPFFGWVSALIALRAGTSKGAMEEGKRKGAEALAAFGTTLVGDVTNDGDTAAYLHDAGIEGCIFHEVFGWNRERLETALRHLADVDAAQVDAHRRIGFSYAPSPHTLYSTAPEAVDALRALSGDRTGSVHYLEHAAERAALETAKGPAVDWLCSLGIEGLPWPQMPVSKYAQERRLFDGKTLLVHATEASPEEFEEFAAAGNPVVLCPRSNLFLHDKLPDLPAAIFAGVRLALGTDSWASCEDLDVLGEVHALAEAFPAVPLEYLYALATRAGADALGYPDQSNFFVGSRPRAFVVQLPISDDPLRALLSHRTLPRTPLLEALR